MIFYGFFSTMYGISAFVCFLDHARSHVIGESAGLFTSIQYAGWFFGTFLGGVLLFVFDAGVILKLLVLILIFLSALAIFFFPGKAEFNFKEVILAEHILAKDGFVVGELKSISVLGKPLISLLLFSFALGFWEYTIWTFEPIYANSLGSGFVLGAVILCLTTLPGMVSGFFAGKLVDFFGEKKMLVLGAVLVVLGQTIFLLKQNLLLLGISLVITSAGAIFILIPLSCYQKKYVSKKLRGEVSGTADACYSIGGILGPVVIGASLTLVDLSQLFYFTSFIFLIAICSLVLMKDLKFS